LFLYSTIHLLVFYIFLINLHVHVTVHVKRIHLVWLRYRVVKIQRENSIY